MGNRDAIFKSLMLTNCCRRITISTHILSCLLCVCNHHVIDVGRDVGTYAATCAASFVEGDRLDDSLYKTRRQVLVWQTQLWKCNRIYFGACRECG